MIECAHMNKCARARPPARDLDRRRKTRVKMSLSSFFMVTTRKRARERARSTGKAGNARRSKDFRKPEMTVSLIFLSCLFLSFFRCTVASLYEGVSVRPCVRPSVRPWVRESVSIKEKRGLGASYVGYPALFCCRRYEWKICSRQRSSSLAW